MPMKRITVLLAEDHQMVREGLRALLKMHDDIDVVGEADNGFQAVALASQLVPDVVIMDLAMPLLGGLEAIERIRRSIPASTKVLVLSAYDDDGYVEKARELGASGYIVKQSAAQVLPTAIREIFRGRTYFKDIRHIPIQRP